MNTWKLAITNMKKSVGDYVVYFITLILGVAIFYIFNAIGDQALVGDLTSSGYEMIKTLITLLTGASVGVAFVLGFLIVYANNFLIRRRKKEFGIYLLLGMGKRQVSAILFCETLIAGLLSLGIGLGVGILGSQFLSILVGNFFEADLSGYRFSFSIMAAVKTVISFVVMNVVVLLFHAATITKYQLVDLLQAGKKPETNIVGGSLRSVILFVLSVVVLGYAYYRVGFCPGDIRRNEMFALILGGAVANMVFFVSLAGFLMEVLRKPKGFYLRKLNAFVIRQFCAGLSSSAITMGIICLMLFATILSFVVGFSMANEFQGSARERTPLDFSIQRTDGVKVSDYFERMGTPMSEWAKDGYVEVPIYAHRSMTFTDTVGGFIKELKEQFPMAIFWNDPAQFMALSDYNRLMRKYGEPEAWLERGSYLTACTVQVVAQSRNEALRDGVEIVLGDLKLKPASSECLDTYLFMSTLNMDFGTIIIADEDLAKAREEGILVDYITIAAGDYQVSAKQEKAKLDNWLNQGVSGLSVEGSQFVGGTADPNMMVATKIAIRESNNGLAMILTFLVTYVGVVFLLASAAILSLKALSESVDSQERYAILKKLGADGKMLRQALFAQISVFFLLPMLVAALHSLFGLQMVKEMLMNLMAVEAGYGVAVTVAVMVVLYGGYMLAAIKSSEKIVKI